MISFFMYEEAEAAAAAESPYEVLVNDWIAGKKELVLMKKEAGQ